MLLGTEFIPERLYTIPILFYVLLLIAAALTCYHYWFLSTRYSKLGRALPGPTPIPLFGNALVALKALKTPDFVQIVLDIVGEYDHVDIGACWLGHKLYVATRDPVHLEVILNGHLEKSDDYDLFKPWLGDGLLISKGEKWRSHRKMIAPTFHNSILKTFMPVFNKCSDSLIQDLEKLVGKEFDAHDYMSSTTVNILLETVMGIDKQKSKTNHETGFKYAKAVMDMCYIIHIRHVKIWWRPEFIFNLTKMAKEQEKHLELIHSFTGRAISIKKEEYKERCLDKNYSSIYNQAIKEDELDAKRGQETTSGLNYISNDKDDLDLIDEQDVGEKKRLAFLDLLIEASNTTENQLNEQEIKEEVDTIMFEGHDTTAAALSFVLCLLGIHKDVQTRVIEELDDIFQGSSRPVGFNDILEMKYLERVILETLRLYPPVPLITRKVNAETKLPDGYTLPANCVVAICPFVIHRNPKIYENPEVFDPDNFLPERCQKRHHYGYIPFSAGPRSCVGRKYAMLKIKVVLANILRKFTVTSPVGEKDFQLQADIILKRHDGFRILLKRRTY